MENLFQKTLNRYLKVLGTTLRPPSAARYKFHVDRLIDYLQTHHPDITSFKELRRVPHIEGWLHSLRVTTPPIKNNTRSQHIRGVRRFLEDIFEWGWPEAPPSGLIHWEDYPPRDKYLPKPIPPDVDTILMKALQKIGDPTCLGLVLARWTGLRIGELVRLDLNCMMKNPDERYSLRVPLGKLHTERVIPIDKETASLIETIKKKRGQRPAIKDPETGRPLELLFCSETGKRRSRNTFLKRLKVVARSCGISENVHPHRLRHTYATELIRCGVSLPTVMKLLGHKKLDMTLRYVEVTNEDLGKAYLNAVTKIRQQYAGLNRFKTGKNTLNSIESQDTITEAFDELVARIQTVRFDHPDPNKRKKLQRLVERLRRIQNELPDLVE